MIRSKIIHAVWIVSALIAGLSKSESLPFDGLDDIRGPFEGTGIRGDAFYMLALGNAAGLLIRKTSLSPPETRNGRGTPARDSSNPITARITISPPPEPNSIAVNFLLRAPLTTASGSLPRLTADNTFLNGPVWHSVRLNFNAAAVHGRTEG